MEETKFSNQNMQKYYNKIMSMETSDLNVIIAEKKLVKCIYDLLYFIFCTRSSTKSAT